MDIFSHVLAGELASNNNNKRLRKYIILFALLPDIGEIFIQIALTKKYGAVLGVYDDRTSDIEIASNISVTWVYDLLHSPMTMLFLFIPALYIRNHEVRYFFKGASIGLFTHIVLDFSTHGHIWALKLLYPFSNERYKIFPDYIGNWWDWNPKISLIVMEYGLPLGCVILWVILSVCIFISRKNNKDESKI